MKFWVEPGKYAKEILGDFRLNWVSINNLDSRLKADFNRCQMLLESISTCQAPEMNFFPEATSIQEETYTTPDIYTVNLRGVYLCTEYNILYTEDLNIIEDSISAKRDLNRFDIKFFRNKKSGVISEACSIFRSYKNGYYHTLIDNLPRLYLLNHNRFSDTDLIKILCTSEPTKVEKFYLDRLLPNNAQITVIDQNKNYLMENLIFPSFLSRRFSGFLPSEYLNWFIGKTAPKRSRKKVNRIFISRVSTYKGSQRCILNEDDLFARLEPHGFKKIILDEMGIEDQIALFYDADFVVAAHGAGLSNTIFSEKIKVIELFPSDFVIPQYYYLAQSLGHQYSYWCAQEKGRDDNFNVDVDEVLRVFEGFN